MSKAFFNVAKSVIASDGEAVLAKVLDSKGSTPGKIGHMMLVRRNGQCSGTIGGGSLEVHCIKAAMDVMRRKKGRRERLVLDVKGDFDIQMACSGEVEIGYEYYENTPEHLQRLEDFTGLNDPAPRLVIIGAGHVSQALGPMMKECGFDIVIADDRPEFANFKVHPEADLCKVVDYGHLRDGITFLPGDYVAIMTQGHKGDISALLSCIAVDKIRYIGVIGSTSKIALAFDKLREAGVSEEKIKSIYAPIGIRNGGRSAQEIAISIACQITGVRYGYF